MGIESGIPEAFRGYLGWSNKRGGVEFYSLQNDENGRWVERRTGGPDAKGWGDLLADEMEEAGYSEGCELIVVAVPRFGKPEVGALWGVVLEAVGEAMISTNGDG